MLENDIDAVYGPRLKSIDDVRVTSNYLRDILLLFLDSVFIGQLAKAHEVDILVYMSIINLVIDIFFNVSLALIQLITLPTIPS
jgi:hypothetical protein